MNNWQISGLAHPRFLTRINCRTGKIIFLHVLKSSQKALIWICKYAVQSPPSCFEKNEPIRSRVRIHQNSRQSEILLVRYSPGSSPRPPAILNRRWPLGRSCIPKFVMDKCARNNYGVTLRFKKTTTATATSLNKRLN